MSLVQVASGNGAGELHNMEGYSHLIPEGSRGVLQLNTYLTVPQPVINGINSAIKANNIPNAMVIRDGNKVKIHFKKDFWWLPAIIGILSLLLVLAIIVASWILFKEVGVIAGTSIMVLGIAVAAVAGIFLVGRLRNAT